MSMINRVLSDTRPKSIAELRMDLKRVPKNQIIDAFIQQTIFLNGLQQKAEAKMAEEQSTEQEQNA